MPSKTRINFLFNDICYLFIACFDWKIGIFQQTVVSVYYILKLLFNRAKYTGEKEGRQANPFPTFSGEIFFFYVKLE